MKKKACGPVTIPDKLYFKIGEVSALVGVPAYVLRFWETEFRQIIPRRTESGQRLYRRQDVVAILRVKELLHDRRYTIEGARQHLKKDSHRSATGQKKDFPTGISDIRDELIGLRDLIDSHRRRD